MSKVRFYFNKDRLDSWERYLNKSPINAVIGRYANKRAQWIDSTIQKSVPSWKLSLLTRFKNSPWLKKLLNVRVEIITEELINQFGSQIIIKLNGKIIGKGKFLINE